MSRRLTCSFIATIALFSAEAQAFKSVTPVATLNFSTADISGSSRGSNTHSPAFSLKQQLQHKSGAGCHASLKVTPLSFVGDILSVQLQGTVCQNPVNTVETFSVGGKAIPSLEALTKEQVLLKSLINDPYLKRNWNISSNTVKSLNDLDIVMSQKPFYNQQDCRLSPSGIMIAAVNYAFWQQSKAGTNIRMALPFDCGDNAQSNAFQWLGLNIPEWKNLTPMIQAATKGQGFLYTNRPKVATTLRW